MHVTRFTVHVLRLAMRTVRVRIFTPLVLTLGMTAIFLTVFLPTFLPRQKRPGLKDTTRLSHVPRAHKVALPANVAPGAHDDGVVNSSFTTSESGRYYLTVIPRGRLGNQMFEYASLLGIADVNDREPFVSSSCKVTHYFANISVSDKPVSGWDVLEELNYAQKDPTFDSLPPENVRLKGFFQSWKYFARVSQKVKDSFVFLPDVQEAVQHFFANSTKNTTEDVIKIGVHVRRTDMLHKVTQKQGYVPAPVSYLRKAFHHMRVRFGNESTFFFIVSDDPDWCLENLMENQVTIVDPAPSVVHLGFLALCDHVIMTVGTFGWWAAYLSGGHVVYYAGYPRNGSEIAKGFDQEDFYLPHWVGIED